MRAQALAVKAVFSVVAASSALVAAYSFGHQLGPAGSIGASGLTGRLQAIEQDWASSASSALHLTRGDLSRNTPAFDPEAFSWDIPALGRVAVGQSVVLAANGGSGHDLVVSEINVVDDASVTLTGTIGEARPLLLTLRSKAGHEAAASMRMLVSGTPVIVPVAPAESRDKAL